MSFHRRKQRAERQMLTYTKTLGKSLSFEGILAKVIQFGWWLEPMSSSPSQLDELGIFCISDQGGS